MATFGKTALGGSSEYTGLVAWCKFTSPGSTGTITSMSAWVSSAVAANVRMAIYAESGGGPTTKLAESSTAAAVDSSDVAAVATVTLSYAFAATTAYWLALLSDNAGGNTRYYYDAGAANQACHDAATYPTWPDPSTAVGILARDISIYATYSAASTSALEWKAPTVQLTNHHVTSIINMRATTPLPVPAVGLRDQLTGLPVPLDAYRVARERHLRATSPMPVPYLPTTATRVTNPLDWVSVTPDVFWTDG